MELWLQWLNQQWPHLLSGMKVEVMWALPHPQAAGFSRTILAEGHGQVFDWELPLTDGSRIHVHEFPDGRLVAHRDAINPSRGPLQALAHWFTESALGGAVLVVGSIAVVGIGTVALVQAANGTNKRSRSR